MELSIITKNNQSRKSETARNLELKGETIHFDFVALCKPKPQWIKWRVSCNAEISICCKHHFTAHNAGSVESSTRGQHSNPQLL